ncbi:FMN-binding negative transcriptional regulator [Sphingomonas lycopersici]|uniref:FMN-binding negative transcriptional regulator n=1 Tax=Sphingomonas lycopersici TaxID=2951807 RepID=A0AA41ZAY7_9SPHN|nr:FMN-binding negative transcriptional regulator [Sphingomonas lycopersici]MCW6530799.1 FMN-binding negative transcriptional regulator [Sphingomonas lycopersici]MCW6536725.1 FMN-binding negative transcriptional regulator [Sphingomonas lycopersici]
MNPAFDELSPFDVASLVEAYPLAWVTAHFAGVDGASLLPLVGVYDEHRGLTSLIGHMSRANPLAEMFATDPRALILFTGPQGYVSPEHAGLRDWAPTWNYAQLRVEAEVRFTPERTDAALDMLIEQMEQGRVAPWQSTELGARYAGMRKAIIGFEANVKRLAGRFKLGQDENDTALTRILASHPDPALVEWMQRSNAGRGKSRASS